MAPTVLAILTVLHDMRALRHKDLVYIPLAKHASISHTHFFEHQLGWQAMQTDQIDWTRDHVFAHLLDPYRKHRKGLVQAIKIHGLQYMLEDPGMKNLLLTCLFDHHSYPISYVFGAKIMFVDWILLDHHMATSEQCTASLLRDHGIHIDPADIPHDHKSDDAALELESQLERYFLDNQTLAGTLTYFYDDDFYWYHQVYRYTRMNEIQNLTWYECSWLHNFPAEQKTLQSNNFATLFKDTLP